MLLLGEKRIKKGPQTIHETWMIEPPKHGMLIRALIVGVPNYGKLDATNKA